jgi:hypothetical protein
MVTTVIKLSTLSIAAKHPAGFSLHIRICSQWYRHRETFVKNDRSGVKRLCLDWGTT